MIASTVAPMKTAKPNRSDQAQPSWAMPAAMPPPIAAPATLAIEIRELALTSVKPSGSSRGTAEAWVTRNALEATRQPSAAGNSHSELSSTSASTQHRKARRARVTPIAQRRPCRNRSRKGPISGATTANGAMVSSRNWATCGRAWSVGRVKNKVPASDTATAASPAAARNCRCVSRARPLSPAPPDRV